MCLQLTCWQASSQTSPRIPRRLSHGRQERKDIPLSPLSQFLYRRAGCPLNPSRCLSLCQLRKFCYSWMLVPGSETLGQPKCHRAGNLCDPLLPCVPSLPHSDTQTQTDCLIQTHSCISPCIRPFKYLASVCLLPLADRETVGLLPTPLPMLPVYGMKTCMWKWV